MTAVVFDLDGTLIDSAPDLHRAVNLMLERHGFDPLTLVEVTSFVGNGLPKLVERVMRRVGIDLAHHQTVSAEVLADYNTVNGEMTRPYPGVSEMLEGLARAGNTLAICTNKPEAPAHHILTKLRLDGYFQVVIGGDTLTVRKPDPAPLDTAISALGADKAGAIYVGDSEIDANTAVNANVPFALFSGGYRKSPITEIPHDFVFDEFEDLTRYFSDLAATRG